MALTADTAHRKDLNAGPAKMEHRHYATIAAIIRDMQGNARLHLDREDVGSIAEHFARHLRSTNPRFSASRFLAACMHGEG